VIAQQWYVLFASASILTLAWLFLEKNLAFSTILAAALWFVTAYTGGDLTRITDSGTQVSVSAPELQYVALALGLASLLARFLYSMGEYPPRVHNDVEGSQQPASPSD
jgi:lysylphosphatidylglycerol synthetase-like protein (DUF2156 family)